MARLPFDPDKLSKPEMGSPARRERARGETKPASVSGEANASGMGEASGAAAQRDASVFTVTKLSEMIKLALDHAFPNRVTVIGEISNFSDRKHWYLSLKDENSVISCAMWASSAAKCTFKPSQGQQVIARGRLDYYGPQGRLQLYIDKLEPAGLGPLEQRYRELLKTLRERGYFDDVRKKPLPSFPQRIAIITSNKAAALQDVRQTAHNRWPGCQLFLVDVRVQGDAAAGEVANAIRWVDVNAEKMGIDAMIITRGGGSLEDLWAFNEQVVADAVYHANLPIVAAIGHETDTTIAELVADLRCSTPTQAAERLVPDRRAELQHIDQLHGRLQHLLQGELRHASSQLKQIERHEFFRQPTVTLDWQREKLKAKLSELNRVMRDRLQAQRDDLASALEQVRQIEPSYRLKMLRQQLEVHEQQLNQQVTGQTSDAKRELQRLEERLFDRMDQSYLNAKNELMAKERELNAVSPRQVLDRGYAYTTNEQGKVVKSVKQAKTGDMLVTHLADGRLHSQILRKGEQGAVVKKKKSRAKKGDDGETPSLFGEDNAS